MNLEKLAGYLNKYLLPAALLLFTGIFLAWGVYNLNTFFEKSRFLQTPLPPVLTSADGSLNNPGTSYSVSFASSALSKFAQEVETSTAEFGVTPTQLNQIAQRYGISGPSTTTGSETRFRQGALSMSYDQTTATLNFTRSVLGNQTVGFRSTNFTSQVNTFLQTLGLDLPDIQITQTTYLKAGLEALGSDEIDPSSAHLAVVNFKFKHQNSILADRQTVTFNSNGQVVNFNIRPFANAALKEKYPRKDFAEVEEALKAGQVLVLDLQDQSLIEEGAVMTSVVFTEISQAFLMQPQEKLLQPVYLLTGTGQTSSGSTEVTAVMPSVKGLGVKE
jgi:hypothetical protein